MKKKIICLVITLLLAIVVQAGLEITLDYPSQEDLINSKQIQLKITTNEIANCSSGLTKDTLNLFDITNTQEHLQNLTLNDDGVYNYFIQCNNNSTTANLTLIFTIDSQPPIIINHLPTNKITTAYTTFTITTNENSTCRYSTTSNVNYENMVNTFDATGGTTHKESLTSLIDNTYYYYVKCKDAAENKATTDYKASFEVNTPPRAQINLSDPSPLKAGTIIVTLITFEDVKPTPSLTYSLDGSTEIDVPLSGSGKLWKGYMILPSSNSTKIGSFKFSAIDIEGGTGTVITGGNVFLVDTEPPPMPILTLTNQINSNVKLSWYYDGEAADGYNIYKSTTEGVDKLDFYKNITTKSYIDTLTKDQTIYYYRVSTIDKAGNEGKLSNEISYQKSKTVTQILQTEITEETNISNKREQKIIQIKSSINELIEELEDLEFNEESELLNPAKLVRHARIDLKNLKNSLENLEDLSELELNKEVKQVREELARIKSETPKKISQNKEEIISVKINEEVSSLIEAFLEKEKIDKTEEEIDDYLASLPQDILDLQAKFFKIIYLDNIEKEKTLISHKVKGLLIVEIPKSIAQNVKEIEFQNSNFEIIKADPIIKWESEEEISFLISDLSSDDLRKIKFARLDNLNQFLGKGNKLTGAVTGFISEVDFYDIAIVLGILLILGLVVYFFVRVKMRWFLLMLLFFLLIPLAIAEDQIVINSKDWQDVYSGSLYASLIEKDFHYIAEETQGIQLITDRLISPTAKETLLIESKDQPFIIGYQANLENYGLEVEKLSFTSGKKLNLELAHRLKNNITNFIIIDDTYGYNAVIVIPYALASRSYVLLADKHNIDEIVDFLIDALAEKILIFGRVDREVKEKLAGFDLEIINEGNKYKDNIELMKKFRKFSDSKQIIFTDGEFLESGLFQGEHSLMLIGKSRVPDIVIDYIDNSDFKTGVTVGYDVFENARTIREATGLKMFYRYGQGWGSNIYALTVFPLPSYIPQIAIKAIRYNLISKQLEVVCENKKDLYVYAQAISHDLKLGENSIAKIGDEKPFFLDGEEIKALAYSVDLTEYADEEIIAESTIVYGETPGALERMLRQETIVELISIEDKSKIKVEDLTYNEKIKRFEIIIKNTEEIDVYADPEIEDLIIAGEKVTLGGEIKKIRQGKKEIFKIRAELEEVDYEDNSVVKVRVRFGERKNVLIKSSRQDFSFELKAKDYRGLILLVIIIILLLLIWYIRKKKKEHKHH